MRALSVAASLLCLGALAEPARAAGPPGLLVVNSASADGGVLSIQGANFGEATPYVTLAGLPLPVLSSSQVEIQALLPDPTPPGSYRLLVARNPHHVPFYLFDVTLGAAGPQGEPGPQGPPGPPGPDVTAQIAALQKQVAGLTGRVVSLEAKLAHVSVAGNDITISGANLYVNSGSGATDGPVNGLGNVIIGYNEPRGAGDDRSGSHNLVVGSQDNYASYGGVVAGSQAGAGTPFSIDTRGEAIALRTTAGFSLDAGTNIGLTAGLSAALQAGSSADVRAGTSLRLRGGAQAELRSGGTLVVNGPIVQIN